jgi:hypothetical protein
VNHSKPSGKYLSSLQTRYRKAKRRQRGPMLDEFVATTRYHRKYAIALLRGTVERVEPGARKPRRPYYTELDRKALRRLADLFDQIGSKRLRAALDATLPALRANGFLNVNTEVYQHLEQMSPATMDRLRVGDPQRLGHARSLTKPGSLLKDQIPIRTYADWNDKRPGFMEMDLVDHSGGLAQGDFAQTLNMTDVASGWTEMQAVPNKAQRHVFTAIQTIRARLPFTLLGIDSDNGGEFINDQLWRYCKAEKLTFTRGRSGRKNDNAYVEQKNWSVIRRLVGYGRYDTLVQVKLLNQLFAMYRLYVNFFLPIVKLQSKIREGSRTRKVYDQPRTPYQRLLHSATLTAAQKQALTKQYLTLDVVQLKQTIDRLLDALKPSPLR